MWNQLSETARSRVAQVLCHTQQTTIHTCQKFWYASGRNVAEQDGQKQYGCVLGQAGSYFITSAIKERRIWIRRRHHSTLASFNCCPSSLVKSNWAWLQWNSLPPSLVLAMGRLCTWADVTSPGRQLWGQRMPHWVEAMALAQGLLPAAEHASISTSLFPFRGAFSSGRTELLLLEGAKQQAAEPSKTGLMEEERGGDDFPICHPCWVPLKFTAQGKGKVNPVW